MWLAIMDERRESLARVLGSIERKRLGVLIARVLSKPLSRATWNGDSSSIAVKGDGGRERLDEIEAARPSPLGRRMSSSDAFDSAIERLSLVIRHFELARASIAIGAIEAPCRRFLRVENKVDTCLISRVGPETLPLLPADDLVDGREMYMFSTAGGKGTGTAGPSRDAGGNAGRSERR